MSSDAAVGRWRDRWWRTTWPLGRRQWAELGVALVVITACFTLVGWLLTDVFAPNPVTRLDGNVADRLVDSRTPSRTDLAEWGAMLADTTVKIIASILLAALTLALWRRWHEAVLIAVSLTLEATAFVIASFIVGRPRPDVPRLLDSPVNSSFPSGHVAAATVYGAIVVIVFWHTRSLIARAVVVLVFTAIPVVVAWARMYQGMHYLSDVVAGALLGLVTLAACVAILGPPVPGRSDRQHDREESGERQPAVGVT
jgi:membrane-associated phospholipid phosphatase